MSHNPLLIVELRALEPVDGWSRSEHTGRACAVCPCGLNTGFIDKAEAGDAYRKHQPKGSTSIRCKLQLAPDNTFEDMIRRALKRPGQN